MTQEDAKRALQDASAEHLKKAFSVLVDNVIDGDSAPSAKFTKALQFNQRAVEIASKAIESVFPKG